MENQVFIYFFVKFNALCLRYLSHRAVVSTILNLLNILNSTVHLLVDNFELTCILPTQLVALESGSHRFTVFEYI